MQERKSSIFEISIKDNFFKKNLFKKILSNLNNLNWSGNLNILNSKKHPWFASPLKDPKIEKYIIKEIKKLFNKEIISFYLINYTLVTKVQNALPHHDLQKNVNYQLLIYLKGDPLIHNGTGFYIKKENNFILNTHIGFNENRAIFFKAGLTHSPLTWAENSSKRFSIICFLKIKD
jgi:hypothetical protein